MHSEFPKLRPANRAVSNQERIQQLIAVTTKLLILLVRWVELEPPTS